MKMMGKIKHYVLKLPGRGICYCMDCGLEQNNHKIQRSQEKREWKKEFIREE